MKTLYTGRQIRFWEYINDGLVRLTLRPGETINWTSGGPHDEGWSRTWGTLTCQEDGTIIRQMHTEGRDCDGPHSSDWVGVAIGTSRVSGYLRLEWETLNARQRDYFAESMGY